MTLREFGTMVDLSHAYIRKLEIGIDPVTKKEIYPTIEVIQKIARCCDMTIAEFLQDTDFQIQGLVIQPTKPTITPQEQELLSYFRSCDIGEQGKILGYAEFAAKSNKYNDNVDKGVEKNVR